DFFQDTFDRGHDRWRRYDGCRIDRIGTHWPRNVLDALLPHVLEPVGKLVSDLITYHPRDANPTRLSKSLQPGRDINGVAEKIAALHDDAADVDADPKPHLLTDRSIRILFGHGPLNFDGTLDGIHRTGEIGDEAVARRGEDPTAMRGDQGIDDGS